MKRIVTLFIVTAVAWTLAVPALATQPVPEFYDTFSEQSYSGNDGTIDFNGPWIELGESNGPASGSVWVWDHEYCGGGYCLKMGGTDDGAEDHGAYRAADLTGATNATFSFDDGVQLLDEESDGLAVVQISSDGGDTWKTLDTIDLEEEDGSASFHEKYNISDFASRDTVIRFKITEAEDLNAYWIIDNVVIEATFEAPTTTTTTAPTTTTTTEPPKSTSTTTTSTTEAPETSTTTHPRDKEKQKGETVEPPEETTTTTTTPNTTTTSRSVTTTTTEPPAMIGSGVPPADRETMMEKTALAVPAASGVTAMPASMSDGSAAGGVHIEPLSAFAAAFMTESGKYGGNLVPSVLLGIVIAVVSLLGISSRKET